MSAFVSARPIRSMTGYARASCDMGEIAVTLRSVNHRGLDLHFHLAPEFDPHENLLRAALKESLVSRPRRCAGDVHPIGESEPGGIEHPNDQLITGGIYRRLHDLQFLEADTVPQP